MNPNKKFNKVVAHWNPPSFKKPAKAQKIENPCAEVALDVDTETLAANKVIDDAFIETTTQTQEWIKLYKQYYGIPWLSLDYSKIKVDKPKDNKPLPDTIMFDYDSVLSSDWTSDFGRRLRVSEPTLEEKALELVKASPGKFRTDLMVEFAKAQLDAQAKKHDKHIGTWRKNYYETTADLRVAQRETDNLKTEIAELHEQLNTIQAQRARISSCSLTITERVRHFREE